MTPLRVLILEDRPADAELILHELRKSGFDPSWQRVDTESEYRACLDGSLDVILADHSLPRFNSQRALELLHEQGLSIPFIVVSGAIGEDVAVAVMKAGATDYLLKDRLARLGPAVAHAVQQQQLRNEKRRMEQRLEQAEALLRRQFERLNILHQIDQATLAARSPEAVADAALSHIRDVVPCDVASVITFNFAAHEFTVLALHIHGLPRLSAPSTLPLGAYGELHMDILRGHKLHTADDVLPLFDSPLTISTVCAADVRSTINLPLMADGTLMGALNLVAPVGGAFDAQHLEITREIADSLAVGIHQAVLRGRLLQHAAELEHRVAARTAELQRTNAELEAFAYTVSHDLRSPLRALQGFATALLEDYGPRMDAVGRDYCERIVRGSTRMDQLIQDLLAYSRIGFDELLLSPVALQDVLADASAQLDAEFRRRAADVTIATALPLVVAHRSTLVQVVVNLLTNAIKFVPAGVQPCVCVRAEARTDAGHTDGQPTGARRAVRLWVEDNGIGIAPEYHERIFGVFERLHAPSVYPGTGIGLAIVRKAVSRMGGRAGVESQAGAGSRFWIELPAP